MSFDKYMEWIAIGSWTLMAGYQMGTAIIDYGGAIRKKIQEFLIPTDYQRMVNGETRNGWKLAISAKDFCKNWHELETTSSYNAVCAWPTITNFEEESKKWPSFSSATFLWEMTSPNGRRAFSLRRYSLIKPAASETFLKIISTDEKWEHRGTCYLNSRTSMIVYCNRLVPNQLELFITDVFTRKSRRFTIKIPVPSENWILCSYLSENANGKYLHIVLGEDDPQADERWAIFDIKYSLAAVSSPNTTMLEEWSHDVLSFQNKMFLSINAGYPMVAIKHDAQVIENTDNIDCICRDNGQWRMESLTQWLNVFKKTKRGMAILEAGKHFLALGPPNHWSWYIKVPAIRSFSRMVTFPSNDEVLMECNNGEIARRWINAPSLLRIAAEAIFRAKPDLKMCQLKEMSGVDVSDGIVEDGTEEDAQVMYL